MGLKTMTDDCDTKQMKLKLPDPWLTGCEMIKSIIIYYGKFFFSTLFGKTAHFASKCHNIYMCRFHLKP